MSELKLSDSQKRSLRGLVEQPARFKRVGITNATMAALDKRGLAKIRVERNDPRWIDYFWYVTAAGRRAYEDIRIPRSGEPGK